MSTPSPLSAGDQPEYIDALLAYLGDDDPLVVFGETPTALRAATAGLSNAQRTTPEAAGKWSVLEVVQHMGQTEVALGFRYRIVLAEDGPALPAIDQNRWVEHLFPEQVSLEEALDDFAALRAVNLRLLQRVEGDGWAHHGVHSQRGTETLAHMVRLYAAHDRYHLHQIGRILQAIK
jgi:hypothetical protein